MEGRGQKMPKSAAAGGRGDVRCQAAEGGAWRNWEGLNHEILVLIFTRIPAHEQARTVPFVCRWWREANSLNSPVWVRLPQLPLLYWDVVNLTRMANFIGEPLWMDSRTITWGHSSFPRFCVRLDLTKRLRTGIWIHGIKGRFFQKIEYEGLSSFCLVCGLVGHTMDKCPSGQTVPLLSPPAGTPPPPPPTAPPTGGLANPDSTRTSPQISPAREQPIPKGPCREEELGEWNIVKRRPRGKKLASKTRAVASSPSPPAITFTAGSRRGRCPLK
ncbi:hypothetical protein M5K25_013768 [Dendrobium thyrsiflorum]|uniref:Zinc knuckle CX2CX4HX4C domain-containing protein n=1 Tax=Dendrobium thyrsiflorum TaxID=117978 RepID=A0ABD0V1P7_DENTH